MSASIGIIGATGLLGQHAVNAALAAGHLVRVIHRAGSDLSKLQCRDDPRISTSVADLNDRSQLQSAVEGLDAVMNCASYYPTTPKPLNEELDIARSQMANFLAAVAGSGVPKALYLGAAIALTKAESGIADESQVSDQPPDDTNPYVQVKWLMDRMARGAGQDGLPIVIGIPSMTFGEFDYGPTTGALVLKVAKRAMPAYIDGQRNVITGRDAGRGLLQACLHGKPGQRYLLTGHNIALHDLVPLIAKRAGVKPPRFALPMPLARVLSKVQSFRHTYLRGPEPELSETMLAVLGSGQFLNGTRAERELGFKAELSVEEMVDRTLVWFRQEGML